MRVTERPQRCVWIVPTGRRRRALVQEWLGEKRTAAILPKFHTLESFVSQELQYSARPLKQIGGPERILRLARAWQEITGRTAGAGLIHQLDRLVRDWQAGGLPLPNPPKDDFERLIVRQLEELARDGCLDRMGSVGALVEEISEGRSPLTPLPSPPGRKGCQVEAILFDGFHRLERLELELIATLARRCEVFLWLVGNPGQRSWQTVESATKFLKSRVAEISVVDHFPKPLGSLAGVGRALFAGDADPQMSIEPSRSSSSGNGRAVSDPLFDYAEAKLAAPARLFKLEAVSPLAEVEAVAKRIKNNFLKSQAGPRPLRLSDIAVVIPGPGYDSLIREAFPRAGLEFNLAGRALLVSTSRPARVLMAAVKVVHGQWRYDLLLDFLNHPLVKKQLNDAHRLYDLFDHRPRARRQLDYQAWVNSWQQLLARQKRDIEGWKTDRLDLPERVVVSREEYVQRQTERVESLERLIGSVQAILAPVAALDRMMAAGGMPSPPSTTGKDKPRRSGGESMAPIQLPMRELIGPLVELLRLLEVGKWLTPPGPLTLDPSGARRGSPDPADSLDRMSPMLQGRPAVASGAGSGDPRTAQVLWVEYEKDQQAYFKLLSILETLKDLPAERLPLGSDHKPVPLRALELALDGETYQIKTEDDAGVQVFEIREIRGLRFRQVYMLGLVNGQVPALPEEGTLVSRRQKIPLLDEQLRQKEAEAEYLFSQLFEAAEEELVLSRPTLEGDQKLLPSPFLTAVEALVDLPAVDSPELVVSWREAASELGKRAASVHGGAKRLTELWPGLEPNEEKQLGPVLEAVSNWQRKPRGEDLSVDWPELWSLLFPDDYLFSASQLETYAACPFRFFGSQILGLEEREGDDTRLHYGSLVHRVLQRFYAERRQRLELPAGRPLSALDEQDRANLIELFRQEWERVDEGTIPPHLEKLFCCPGGVLDLFLEMMTSMEEANFGNLATELELPRILLGKDSQGRSVFLTGKIDRVDGRRDDPAVAIILDYKTGRIISRSALGTKLADGRLLQLPLYAAALRILRADLEIIGAAYLHLHESKRREERGPQHAIASVGQLLAKGIEADEDVFNLEAARRRAIKLAEDIRAGRFPLTRFPKGDKEPECTRFCLQRHACRHPEGYQEPYGY
jgi:hypothetical protein